MNFKLDDYAQKKLKEWLESHECRLTPLDSQGAIDRHITYEFTPTTINTMVNVRCACGFRTNLNEPIQVALEKIKQFKGKKDV